MPSSIDATIASRTPPARLGSFLDFLCFSGGGPTLGAGGVDVGRPRGSWEGAWCRGGIVERNRETTPSSSDLPYICNYYSTYFPIVNGYVRIKQGLCVAGGPHDWRRSLGVALQDSALAAVLACRRRSSSSAPPASASRRSRRCGTAPKRTVTQQTHGLAFTLDYALFAALFAAGSYGSTDLALARLQPLVDPVDRGQPQLGPALGAGGEPERHPICRLRQRGVPRASISGSQGR